MLRNGLDAFGWVTILLHWTIAILIAGLLVLGYAMARPGIDPVLQFDLFQWHKSFGFTALGFCVIRVLWWLAGKHPAPVAGLSARERHASFLVHILLLCLTLAVPVTGWALASTSTLDIPSFYFNIVVIPHLPLEKSALAEALWTTAHAVLAYSLAALVLLHAGAALHHHFIRHDAVLVRMLRNRRQNG
ncbi:cytochrome b [Rhizobium sp. PL01]|uniref:cytochrome b n=1 Tax=Rhizobium sp. PL01 TaxID=3085631 RepID=UPI0029817FEF|nr:cytochrome b [Rhizobium sp. PL01]MDW5313912.1 cytochrome b [Rhizobium sp. PL01]